MPRRAEPVAAGPGGNRQGGTDRAAAAARGDDQTVLDARDLRVHFTLQGGLLQRLLPGSAQVAVQAVDGVSFTLRRGEVLGIVGESGSGKTTLGRALLGLAPATGGSVRLLGRELNGLPEREFRRLRRRVQMIFQDPHAALNPSMELGAALAHPLRIHGLAASAGERRERVREALELVGLTPAESYLHALPGGLSGGQRQRAVIARAVISGPEVLVADEPVSMLDMSVRAKLLELMLDLRSRLGLSYLYITHDLATARYFCDRIAIMYLGRIVEIGPVAEIYADPQHPYTRALLRAIPEPDPSRHAAGTPRDLPGGEVPDAARPPRGCGFHPRCPRAFGPCGWEGRDLRQLLEQHWVESGEDAYARERALLGDLDRLDAGGRRALVPAAAGVAPGRVRELLESLRAARPDEPLWSGLRQMSEADGGVLVEFNDGVDPGLYDLGEVRAACLLHDPALRPGPPDRRV